MELNFPTQDLIDWFEIHKRPLPWRINPSPYSVWVSEVMLQQTQVKVVIPYYMRWMENFSTIEALAKADRDLVIKLWEGLGYYARARNLHAGAQYVLEHYNGSLPEDPVALKKIKGLGPYTIGAILSFAFHKKAAAVDGNVARVLARFFRIEEVICQPKVMQKIRALNEDLLPEKNPWTVVEALIELGATVCQKTPQCSLCPLQKTCQAKRKGLENLLPNKAKRAKTEHLHRAVALICWEDQFLVKRVSEGNVMSDLHEFPYFENDEKEVCNQTLLSFIEKTLSLKVAFEGELPDETHSFTKYRVRLSPRQFQCLEKCEVPGYQWLSLKEMESVAFSSGHRRIFLNANPQSKQRRKRGS